MIRSTARLGFAAGFALLSLWCAAPAIAGPREDIHEAERAAHNLGDLRPGADGNNPAAPNASNMDEAKVGALPVPPLFEADKGETTRHWLARRATLVRVLEDEVYGRVPAGANRMRIQWKTIGRRAMSIAGRPATEETLRGTIKGPGGARGPVLTITKTLPAGVKAKVPAVIDMVFRWNGPRPAGFVPAPDPVETVVAAGWGYVAFEPIQLQADDGGGLPSGIIGLVGGGATRGRHDWGTLRAWGWGASRILDQLQSDSRIDAKRVAVAGLSRYGKAALVAAAFDERFATGLVGSSGAGGAKLMRRDFGERVENLASSGEFHWFAPQFMTYAGRKTVADLPVDAHHLIALVAPRPLFIGTSTVAQGDGWTDPRGQFIAATLAAPAWRLYGKEGPTGSDLPPVNEPIVDRALAFHLHDGGHRQTKNWQPFLVWAHQQLAR